LLVELGAIVLSLRELSLGLVKLLGDIVELLRILLVLSLDVLILLARMRQHDDMVDDLASKTRQLLVPLLDLLVEGLIFDLELLVINEMKTFSQLLLLLQDFLLVSKSVSQSDVLETVLMHFLILGLISLLPLLDDLGTEFLARPAVDSVHRNRALQLLELLLNLRALRLLLIKFVLELASHAIVPILGLLQVVSDLMNVGKGVQVLVLVKHLIRVLLVVTVVRVHQDDLALAVLVRFLQLLVLTTLIFDGRNELLLHSC